MPRPPCPTQRTRRALDLTVLEGLAEHLVSTHLAGPSAGARLVRIRSDRQGIDLGVMPLPEGVHPADVLLGHVVPRRWSVAGVVASGTAHRMDDGTRTTVGLAVLVDRQGRCVHRLDGDGQLPATAGEPLEGRMVDLLRRALGLPTPSPDVAPRDWWDVAWLDAIVAELAADPSRARSFEDLARLHPLVTDEPPGRTLEEVTNAAAWSDVDQWADMRWAAAGAVPPSPIDARIRRAVGPLVSSDVAAWMDDGCFARWLVDALPPADVLLSTTDELLSATTAARVRHVVEGRRGTRPHERPDAST